MGSAYGTIASTSQSPQPRETSRSIVAACGLRLQLVTARAGLSQFWGSITGMGYALLHEPLNIYGDDDRFVLEALNHYDEPGSSRITVRATAWTDRGGEG